MRYIWTYIKYFLPWLANECEFTLYKQQLYPYHVLLGKKTIDTDFQPQIIFFLTVSTSEAKFSKDSSIRITKRSTNGPTEKLLLLKNVDIRKNLWNMYGSVLFLWLTNRTILKIAFGAWVAELMDNIVVVTARNFWFMQDDAPPQFSLVATHYLEF